MVYNHVRQFILKHGVDRTYCVAYSGGLDSQALLFALHLLRAEFPFQLKAIHIHHGLSVHSDKWAAHCQLFCDAHEIQYIEHRLNLQVPKGESIEEMAREARYEFFAKQINTNDVLLTAHHQDDQAETVLLQLLRGAGLRGLSAMPEMKSFASGYHARPFLGLAREALVLFAKEHQLSWHDDESNANQQFSRNFIRHEVMPLLKSRWPKAADMFDRSASHCAEAEKLLSEFAFDLMRAARGSTSQLLSVKKVLLLTPAKQRLVLRTWIREAGFSVPDIHQLAMIQSAVLNAKEDRQPAVSFGEAVVRRYGDDLYLESYFLEMPLGEYEWDFQKPLVIPGVCEITSHEKIGAGLSLTIAAVTVKFRQGGEVAHVRGKQRHTLKNLFQEWRVPVWERDRTPLLFHDGKLIAAAGYFVDPDYAANVHESGRVIVTKKLTN